MQFATKTKDRIELADVIANIDATIRELRVRKYPRMDRGIGDSRIYHFIFVVYLMKVAGNYGEQ
jgi:hypothetical protein